MLYAAKVFSLRITVYVTITYVENMVTWDMGVEQLLLKENDK